MKNWFRSTRKTSGPEHSTQVGQESHHSKHPKKSGALSTIGILILAPVVAILLTVFVFQSYQVDGPSMETTLQNNDRLIIYKLPRTWAKLTGHTYLPNRGDIVVFNKRDISQYSGNDKEKQLIKRVIGLPGDRVLVKDGKLLIYNKEHPDGYQPDKFLSYGKVIGATSGNIDLTVPDGELFVCGDNRQNSLDSRTFGTIPAKDVVGKLKFRFLPLRYAKKF